MVQPNEIHVWLMRMPATIDPVLHAMITADEQRRVNNMISARRRNEWVGGRALLRQCLAQYIGCDGLELVFNKTESGKPFLDLPDAPAFNLSHGPGWIACAVAQAESLGIDIDSETRRNRTDDIAARYFHPVEQKELEQAADAKERKHIFFRQWTLKEAYIKALGETINSVRLHDIAFEPVTNGSPCAVFTLASGSWQFLHKHFDGDHHLALACRQLQSDKNAVMPFRFWLWDATTQSRHALTDEWLQAA